MYSTDLTQQAGWDYEIVAADPPWKYTDKANAGQRGACHKYPVASLADLMKMPVGDITAKDSVLFMWTTGPMLVDGTTERLIRAWGFTPKTMGFTWIKLTKTGKQFFWGMGRWTRANPEYVVLAVKGKPTRLSAAVHSVIESPILGHSVKPAEYRDRIVKLMGERFRIELFARGDTDDGWDRFGNEPEGPRTILPAAPQLTARARRPSLPPLAV